jgi:hypothetical protein
MKKPSRWSRCGMSHHSAFISLEGADRPLPASSCVNSHATPRTRIRLLRLTLQIPVEWKIIQVFTNCTLKKQRTLKGKNERIVWDFTSWNFAILITYLSLSEPWTLTVRTLRSWVWSPLETWMFVSAFRCFVDLCTWRPCVWLIARNQKLPNVLTDI